MGFLEDATRKTKEIVDIARQRTSEVVSVEKQRLAIASLKSKREKDYANLGRIYFEMAKNDDGLDYNVRNLIESIAQKSKEIARIKEDIDNIKNR